MSQMIKNKYQIVHEIARSNDIVYEALDVTLGRKVALKVLNFPAGITGQARRERIERFYREAKAAGRLTHPSIVSIYDCGEQDGLYFIAMEYLEGQTLTARRQAGGPLTMQEAADIGSQILDALETAHASGVIHRDIKPDNIFILPDGRVKLTDFGIARITQDQALTSDGQVFGTPSYMSPEQIHGGQIDRRSDLFSTGVLLYELLTLHKPFEGDSVIAITYAVVHQAPAPMHGVPQAVEGVIQRALAKDPNYRFQSAREMQQALQAAMLAPRTSSWMVPPQVQNPTGAFAPPPYPAQQAYAPPPSYAPSANLPGMFLPQSGQQPYAPQQSVQMPQGSMPWGWNGQAVQQPQQPQLPVRYQPLIVVSPQTRRVLLTLALAIAAGILLGLGVLAFINRYNDYKVQSGNAAMMAQIQQAANLYNKQEYAKAAALLQQALQQHPSQAQLQTIDQELAYCYVLLGRKDEAQNNSAQAELDFRSALHYAPSYADARQELASLLKQTGKTGEAQMETDSIPSGAASQPPPSSLNSASDASVAGASISSSQDPLIQQQQNNAQQLLQQGVQYQQQNDLQDACTAWREASTNYPATNAGQQAANEYSTYCSGGAGL